MSILVIVCIVGAILGSVLGSKHSVKTSGAIINWNGSNWARSCDFPGNDISYVRSSSDSCYGKCAQAQACTHYAWNSWNGGTCWMKKDNVSKNDAISTNDPTTVCGIISGEKQGATNSTVLWNGNNSAIACDFHENDLCNVPISSELCGGECAKTPGCTHFTWDSWNGGTCWMKKGNVSKNDAFLTNDPTMVCGVISGEQQEATNSTVLWNGNNWAIACDFPGNDLSNVQISPELCGGKCAQTPGCTHFTWTDWNGGTCWMKNGNVSKNDALLTNDSTMVCGVINSV